MPTIISENRGAVAVIKLNRPEKYNSFNQDMALSMQKALDDATNDNDIRAIYITGEGKAFSAGQDLTEAIDPAGPGISDIVNKHYNPIIKKIRAVEKPVICAVNGVAAGAGANIALACDIIVCSQAASFIQAFSRIGLIPDSGGTFFLPRLIGYHRAAAYMMTGEKITAQDALAFGMVFKLFSDEELFIKGMELAKQLADMPTKALGLTKRLLNESFYTTVDQQLEQEARSQVESASSYDYEEGVKSFLEKRKPVFLGK